MGARCLLVSYAGYPVSVSSLFPDNGLASLAGTLLAAGHEVKILDFNTISSLKRMVPADLPGQLDRLLPAVAAGLSDDDVERILALNRGLDEAMTRHTEALAEVVVREATAQGSDFVGFKLWSGDGLLACAAMARILRRRRPATRIFGGGPAVTYSEEQVLVLAPVFDALVDGEGETSVIGLAEVAQGRRELATVPNLIFAEDDGFRRTPREFVEDLDQLAMPEYRPEIYPAISDQGQIPLFVLDESRGCPMGCAFCIHQDAGGNRWRIKSAARILDELDRLQDQFGVHTFRFGGSYTPARFFSAFARAAKENKKTYSFSGFAHPSGLPDGDLADLAEAGCKSLFFGVESFDRADLERMGKRMKPETTIQSLERCIEAGIVPVISLLHPPPGQSERGAQRNMDCVLRLCRDKAAVVVTQVPGLLPRTGWWRDRAAYGFDLTGGPGAYRRLLATYKIRHIVPPSLWEQLPYTLDGRPFAALAATNSRFQRELAAQGVVVNLADEVVLVARMLGAPLGPFQQRLRRAFFTLDPGVISRLADDITASLVEA